MYPYLPSTGKLRAFIEGISKRKVPDKIDYKYLRQIGFTSRNDKPIIAVLEFIGFLDSESVPTQAFSDFRSKAKSKEIMETRLRSAYAELFGLYADAYARSRSELSNFFVENSKLGETSVSFMVNTFVVLCEFAFEMPSKKAAPKKTRESEKAKPVVRKTKTQKPKDKGLPPIGQTITEARGLTVHLNIQLVLPVTEDTTLYDAIFKSLKKHIFSSE